MKLLDAADVVILAVALTVVIGLGVLTESMGLGPLPGVIAAGVAIIAFTRVVRL